MFSASFVSFVLAASSVLASPHFGFPHIKREDVPASFQNLGPAVHADNVRFQLAALNTTLPNANSTGVPLTLAIWGETHTESYYSLVTADSGSNEDGWGPTFTLKEGALFANKDSNGGQAWTRGASPTVIFSTNINPEPDAVFCEASEELAVNNRIDLWSLCKNSEEGSLKYVVYNATEAGSEDGDYVFSTCYSVSLSVVAANQEDLERMGSKVRWTEGSGLRSVL